jgi:hypothetical protein
MVGPTGAQRAGDLAVLQLEGLTLLAGMATSMGRFEFLELMEAASCMAGMMYNESPLAQSAIQRIQCD